MGDASGAFVAALAHLTEASFPFPKIWSLYPAILGQAIPSAFGRFRLAVTTTPVRGTCIGLKVYVDIIDKLGKMHDVIVYGELDPEVEF